MSKQVDIENEKPVFDYKRIKAETKCKVFFYTASPAKTGTSSYGDWFLWNVFVINAPINIRLEDGSRIYGINYTGNATFFPEPKLNTELQTLFNGKDMQWIELSKQVGETESGKFYAIFEPAIIPEPNPDEVDEDKVGLYEEVDAPVKNFRLKNPFALNKNGNDDTQLTQPSPFKKPEPSNPLLKLKNSTPDEQDKKLNSNEQKLVNDVLELIDEGYEITKDLVMKASKEPDYGGDISDDRASEIYDAYIKPKIKK